MKKFSSLSRNSTPSSPPPPLTTASLPSSPDARVKLKYKGETGYDPQFRPFSPAILLSINGLSNAVTSNYMEAYSSGCALVRKEVTRSRFTEGEKTLLRVCFDQRALTGST